MQVSDAIRRLGPLLILPLLTSSALDAAKWKSSGPACGATIALVEDGAGDLFVVTGELGLIFRSRNQGGSWREITPRKADAIFTALAAHPERPGVVLAGSREDGIFRTADGGVSWKRVERSLQFVQGIWADPRDSGTFFAIAHDGSPGGPFLFKATDGGSKWKALKETGGARFFAIHPENSDLLYLTTSVRDRRVIRSTNGGKRWKSVDKGLGFSIELTNLTFDPTQKSTLYGTNRADVYRTKNGKSWKKVGALGHSILTLSVNPSKPKELLAGFWTPDAGVWRSTNQGRTWEKSGLPNDGAQVLVRSRKRPGVVYAGSHRNLFRSKRNGRGGWKLIDRGINTAPVISMATASPLDDSTSTNRIFASCGRGVLHKDEGKKTWRRGDYADNPALGSDIPRIQAMAVSPVDSKVVYAAGDGRMAISVDGGESWGTYSMGASGQVGAIAFDAEDPRKMYAAIGTALATSEDGGMTWSVDRDLPLAANIWAVATSPTEPDVVFIGGLSGAARSRDGGSTWDASSALEGLPVQGFAIDPSDGDRLFARVGFSFVFRSVDGGTTWRQPGEGQQFPNSVSSLLVDAFNRNVVYAGTSGGVFRSTDDGETWIRLGGELDTLRVASLALSSSGTLYAGTAGRGVYTRSVAKNKTP